MRHFIKQLTPLIAALAIGTLVVVPLLRPVAVFAQDPGADPTTRVSGSVGTGPPGPDYDPDQAGDETIVPNLSGTRNATDLGCLKFSVSCYVYRVLVDIGAIGTTLATGILFISMTLTNFAAELTLGGANYSSAGMPFLMSGWALVRDFVNLIFIFILLWIAIATVLGLESYGYKQLLPRLIIVAFIINFSLVFTRLVIDASNLLAVQFLNSIGSLPRVFGAALHPKQILLLAQTAGSEGMGGFVETAVQIVISAFLGTFLILAAAFVVLVGGLFLFVRIGVLWFVIILSPAAVAASILPQTRAYFQKWFHLLISYAAFAPIYFFFIWLTGKFIVDSVAGQASVLNQLTSAVNSNPAAAVVGQPGFSGAIFRIGQMSIRYVLTFMLLLLSLFFARQLGIAGANGAWKLVGQARGKALGALRSTGMEAGRFGKRRVMRTAETMADKLAQATPGKIPFAARALSRIASGARASIKNDISALEEKYGRYSDKEKKNLFGAIETTREGKAAITNLLVKNGNLKAEGNFTQEHIASGVKILRTLGLPDKDVLHLRPDLALPGKIADAVKSVTAADIPKMDAVVFKNKEALDAMARYFKQGHAQQLIERTDGVDQDFFRHLITKFGKSSDDIVNGLKNIGNIPLSTFLQKGQGQTLIDSYVGVPSSPLPGPVVPSTIIVPPSTGTMTQQEIEARARFRKTLGKQPPPPPMPPLSPPPMPPPPAPPSPPAPPLPISRRDFMREILPGVSPVKPTPPASPEQPQPPPLTPPKQSQLNVSPPSPMPPPVDRRGFFRQLRPGGFPETPPLGTPPPEVRPPISPPPLPPLISRRDFLRQGGFPSTPPPSPTVPPSHPAPPPPKTPPRPDNQNNPNTP